MTAATTPDWAVVQRDAARARGNELRLRRAEYRRDLRAMSSHDAAAELADVFTVYAHGLTNDALEACEGDYVLRMLKSVRRLGMGRIRRLVESAGAPRLLAHDRLRVRELTAREALALADGLRLLYPTTREASR